MIYRIDPRINSRPVTIAVVGCGGTGGFVADGLCRMLGQDCKLILVDHDRVEEHNLRRQLFYPQDLDKFKAQVLAERLASRYGLAVGYSVRPYDGKTSHGTTDILVACVDNAAARRAIAEKHSGWWLDTGNGKNSGQVLIGNREGDSLRHSFHAATGICYALPLPTIQMPELLIPVPEEMQPRDCAERVQANEQSPIINQMIAGLVLEMVRRLIAGTLTWMGVTLDLEMGTMRPIEADPGVVARMVGMNVNQLVIQNGPERR